MHQYKYRDIEYSLRHTPLVGLWKNSEIVINNTVGFLAWGCIKINFLRF